MVGCVIENEICFHGCQIKLGSLAPAALGMFFLLCAFENCAYACCLFFNYCVCSVNCLCVVQSTPVFVFG